MLYLTAYQSIHLLFNQVPFHEHPDRGSREKYEIFYHPEKATKIWYLENGHSISFNGMQDLIVKRFEIETLDQAISIIKEYQPMVFKYYHHLFDDNEANTIAKFIRSESNLISFQFHYSHAGGRAYRQGGNKLTDSGYQFITQAVEFNPNIQICVSGNHTLSKEVQEQRKMLLQRNRTLFQEKNLIQKLNAYREIYASLVQKYPDEDISQTAMSKMLHFPTLSMLSQSAVTQAATTAKLPFQHLPSQLLTILEPINTEMGMAVEKLSELNSKKAKRAELLYLWKHCQEFNTNEPKEPRLPFVYFPPRLSNFNKLSFKK